MSASDVFTGAAICFVRQLEIIPDRTGINVGIVNIEQSLWLRPMA